MIPGSCSPSFWEPFYFLNARVVNLNSISVLFFFPTCLHLVCVFIFCYDHAGGQKTQAKSGPVILADEIKNPAMEKLELVRKWSLNTYKVCNFLMFPF